MPRIASLLNLHRRLTESPAHFIIDIGIPPGIVRKHVPQAYVEVRETIVMHESYMLNAMPEGI
jgi:hypothetical protein